MIFVLVLNFFEYGIKCGEIEIVVEYSFGLIVIFMVLISQVFYGISDVCVYLSNKISFVKLCFMQFFGLDLLVIC